MAVCALMVGGCSRTVTVVVPASSPGPVASSPSSALSAKCVTGWYTWYPWGNGPDGFYPFVAQSPSPVASGLHVMGSYQLTATNTSGSAVEVSGFVAALYSGDGTELGSDSRAVQSLYITPARRPVGASALQVEATVMPAPICCTKPAALSTEDPTRTTPAPCTG